MESMDGEILWIRVEGKNKVVIETVVRRPRYSDLGEYISGETSGENGRLKYLCEYGNTRKNQGGLLHSKHKGTLYKNVTMNR